MNLNDFFKKIWNKIKETVYKIWTWMQSHIVFSISILLNIITFASWRNRRRKSKSESSASIQSRLDRNQELYSRVSDSIEKVGSDIGSNSSEVKGVRSEVAEAGDSLNGVRAEIKDLSDRANHIATIMDKYE